MVIEWVYRSSQHAIIDYHTLLVCALVCRAWTPIAQRLLFRRIPEYYFPTSNITLLPRTLRASPHLASHVR
ncbi:hypothetical protein FA95DRAFT_653484 [Auriscalpium vulgare]|uniref:Uncharacterized protein n=1 Tax=Auriscalpium vulgare TaxID=40419 RepID=A0ACB8RD18_9AGAM|nr:hypothetical protein FA95DRAFT_653484 [Auriscalpium vulgare]